MKKRNKNIIIDKVDYGFWLKSTGMLTFFIAWMCQNYFMANWEGERAKFDKQFNIITSSQIMANQWSIPMIADKDINSIPKAFLPAFYYNAILNNYTIMQSIPNYKVAILMNEKKVVSLDSLKYNADICYKKMDSKCLDELQFKSQSLLEEVLNKIYAKVNTERIDIGRKIKYWNNLFLVFYIVASITTMTGIGFERKYKLAA